MGCFFGCFRIKDSNSKIVAPPEPVLPRSKNALSSLFSCDDESLRKADEGGSQLPTKDEFLKTPIEKASEKLETKHGDERPSNLSSSPPNVFGEKLKLEKQSDEESSIPIKLCEELVTGSGSLLDSPSSCMTDGHNTGQASSSSISRYDNQNVITPTNMCGIELHTDISPLQSKNNSVQVDSESDMSAISSEHSKESGSVGRTSLTNPFPNSNPPKLSYEMENESSLSSWLKPPSDKKYGNNKHRGPISAKNVVEERPILGMVAAHWNNDVTPDHIKPKWWDGNGIPNSTNKYKEDQKVSWHATPFEERLEKALSEDTSMSQRKSINGTPPVEFINETEESDTALSHFQSSPNLKTVVSF